ncbi:replicative DNA helicase [Alcanivorax sp.]|uniref:replicative DNA helicase n=1 Tax=Alcanivorax sp. TaxID=1872427 RepID=UPI003A8FBF15
MIEQAMQAEDAVIGSVLLNSSVLASLDLTAADFVTPNAKTVWQAIQNVDMAGPVELVTVCNWLRDNTGGRDWARWLSERLRNTPSAVNAGVYAKELRKVRQKIAATEACQQALQEIPSKGMAAIDTLMGSLMEVTATAKNYEYTLKESLAAAIDLMEEARKGKVNTIPTGLVDLDNNLGGLHPSDLVVVGGRPAMGKTAFLLNLALNAGHPVGIISSEQPHEQVGMRTLAIGSGVGLGKLRAGQLTEIEWARLPAAVSKQADAGIQINDRSGISIMELIRQARKWKHMHGIRALYVDYIQRIKSSDSRAKRHEQVGEVVRQLKELARELDIPVVALAQVSRDVEKRNNKRPGMGDMSDSSEIEKEADQIMCLYRDEVYNPDSQDKGILEVLIEKNRHGPTGNVRTFWSGANQRVLNAAREAV